MQNISRNDFLLNMEHGVVSITANNRLKRTLSLEYSKHQKSLSFQNSKIVTLSEWVSQTLEEIALKGLISLNLLPNKILNELEQEIIFTKIIQRIENKHNRLLSLNEIAKQAKNARKLLQLYQVSKFDDEFFETLELKRFKLWLEKYQDFCDKNQYLDETGLLVLLVDNIEKISLNQKIQIAGFEQKSPLLTRLFSALKVDQLQNSTTCKQFFKVGFESLNDEIKSAALWAKNILLDNSDAKIGIIVPELEKHHDLIKNTIKSVFYPEQFNLDLSNYRPVHNLSLGQSLYDYDLITTAITWLEVFYSRDLLDYKTLNILLNSPHWMSESEDINSRIEFDWLFLSQTRPQFTLKQFLNILYDFGGDKLWASNLKTACEKSLDKQKTTNDLTDWLIDFNQLLNLIGLGNFQQSPISEQLLKGLKTAFKHLQAMKNFIGKTTAFEAVKLLKQIVKNQTFQFRSLDDAPIQIMGILESNTQTFDFIWFMSADRHTLPSPVSPNAILPLALQKQYEMPKSSVTHELLYAKKLIKRLKNSTKTLIFSYAKIDENDTPILPSRLIKDFIVFDNLPKLSTFKQNLTNLETISDDFGLPLETPFLLKRAVSFFKAQAICPLMAYAEFRLNAQNLPIPKSDFDFMTRGNLIHQILEVLLSDQNKQVSKIVQSVLKKYAKENQIKEKLTACEIHRVQNIINRWFENFETPRDNFEVYQLEAPLQVNFAGLLFNIIIDRIDKVNDDFLLIDYKTSNQISTKGWIDERLTEPQLPIYATLLPSEIGEVGGVVFAQLSVNTVAVKTLGKIEVWNKKLQSAEDWQAIKIEWHEKLEILANEIKTGQAYFIENDLIERSPAAGFCRVYDDVQ